MKTPKVKCAHTYMYTVPILGFVVVVLKSWLEGLLHV